MTQTTLAQPLGQSRAMFIGLIAAIMSLNAIAIDVMLPALPLMAEHFHITSISDQHIVITIYVLSFGFSQLFWGPISDRFGRRSPLYFGLGIYFIGTFCAMFAPNFETLLLCRVVQGIGAAASRVIAQSVVRDMFKGRAMAEVMSMVMMVFMVIPIFAPMIGQVLLFQGSWQIIFAFMAFLCLGVSAWAYAKLPETLAPADRRPLRVGVIFDGFKAVFTNRIAIFYALATTFLSGAINAYIITSQHIYADIYELGALFPVAFATVGIIMSISSFANSRLVGRFGQRKLSHTAVLCFIIFTAAFGAYSMLGRPPFIVFMLVTPLIMFCFSWCNSNMNSLAMEPLGKLAGTAASTFGFMQMFGGGLLGFAVGATLTDSITPVYFGFTCVGIGAMICILIAEKGKLFGTGSET